MRQKKLGLMIVFSSFAILVALALALFMNATGATAQASQAVQDPQLPEAGINIVKSPAVQTVWSDYTATFTVTISYPGATTLNSVVVADPLAPNCNRTYGSVTSGFTANYTCTMRVGLNNIINTIYITGLVGSQPIVSGTSTAAVQVIHPLVFIDIMPDSGITLTEGSHVSTTVFISNTGDVTLTNVHVELNQPLPPGASTDCERKDAQALGTYSPHTGLTYNCMLTTSVGMTTTLFPLNLRVRGNPPGSSGVPKLDYVADQDSRVVTVRSYPVKRYLPLVSKQ
jgi:hypothetical protein